MLVAAACGALAAVTLLNAGCATTPRPRVPPTAAESTFATLHLNRILLDHWDFAHKEWPELASWAGLRVLRLPDVSNERVKDRSQFARAALRALDDVDIEALAQSPFVSWEVLRWSMETLSASATFHATDLTDVAPMRSALRTTADLLAQHPLTSAADAESYGYLIHAVAPLADSIRAGMEWRRQRGVSLPGYLVARSVRFVRSLIAAADSSPFGLDAERGTSLDSATRKQLEDEVNEAIGMRVNPALVRLAEFLESEPGASRIGIGQYPGGVAHYRHLIRRYSTLDITPEDAHAIGLEEVTRIQLALRARLRTAGWPEDPDSLGGRLRGTPQLAPGDGPALLERFRDYHARAESLRARVLSLPTLSGVEISWMSPAEQEFAPVVLYRPASVTQPSARYAINGAAWQNRSLVRVPARAFMDLVPGRHVQATVQRESIALPAFRRVGAYAGFEDGWSLYAMHLADSLIGGGEIELRTGVLLEELGAACGLVVDTGINYFGWTRDQALGFLRAHLPEEDAELEREFVIPAVEDPGSLTAATLGARELRGLRRWAEQELGHRFDPIRFHDEILSLGAVPLPVLGSHLEWWLWTVSQGTAGDRGESGAARRGR